MFHGQYSYKQGGVAVAKSISLGVLLPQATIDGSLTGHELGKFRARERVESLTHGSAAVRLHLHGINGQPASHGLAVLCARCLVLYVLWYRT